MTIALDREAPPLRMDETGAIRVGNTRVLLELVVEAFEDGAAPEPIVLRYSSLGLADVYGAIAYYLRHRGAVNAYMEQREVLARSVRQKIEASQPDLGEIRQRLRG